MFPIVQPKCCSCTNRARIYERYRSLTKLWIFAFYQIVTVTLCVPASRLEWTVSQWGVYLESAAQLRCWMEAVEREVCAPLTPQPGPREKASQLERLRALLADLEDHQVALSSLEEKAREMFKKTGDASFNHGARIQLQAQFDDLTALVEVGRVLFFLLQPVKRLWRQHTKQQSNCILYPCLSSGTGTSGTGRRAGAPTISWSCEGTHWLADDCRRGTAALVWHIRRLCSHQEEAVRSAGKTAHLRRKGYVVDAEWHLFCSFVYFLCWIWQSHNPWKKSDQFLIHTLMDNRVPHVTGDKSIVQNNRNMCIGKKKIMNTVKKMKK